MGKRTGKPRGRPIATVPTWAALAPQLGVGIPVLYHWRHLEGAPIIPDLEQWQTWCEVNKKGPAFREQRTELREKIGSAEFRYWEARANREERADQVEAGDLITKADAKRLAESVRDAFLSEGDRLPSSVVALLKDLKKSDKQLVEQAVSNAWKSARDRIGGRS